MWCITREGVECGVCAWLNSHQCLLSPVAKHAHVQMHACTCSVKTLKTIHCAQEQKSIPACIVYLYNWHHVLKYNFVQGKRTELTKCY